MTNKYREAMDKIVVSDRLKEKIIRQAAANQLPASEEPPQRVMLFPRNIRRGVGYAACLLLCGVAVSAGIGLHFNTDAPQTALRPSAPVLSANTDDGNIKADENTIYMASALPEDNQSSVAATSGGNITTPQPKPTAEQTPLETSLQPLQAHLPYNINDQNGDGDTVQQTRVGNATADMKAIRKHLGYNFKTPQYIPDGYRLASADLLFGSLVEISYQSPQDTILYRTEKTTQDISGDYTEYAVTATEEIGGCTATLKGNDDLFHNATWNDADTAYSLSSDSGLIKDTFVSIIESVDYTE